MQEKEISCANCRAACCQKGTLVQLSDEEVQFMKETGTQLERIPTKKSQYLLKTNCGYLKQEDGWFKCVAYNDVRRPKVCGEFQEGSFQCQMLRITNGVDKIPGAIYGLRELSFRRKI